jgi:hypothetical protein
VFISHSGAQKRGFVDFLEARFKDCYPDVKVFLDEYDLRPGDDAMRTMRAALQDAHVGAWVGGLNNGSDGAWGGGCSDWEGDAGVHGCGMNHSVGWQAVLACLSRIWTRWRHCVVMTFLEMAFVLLIRVCVEHSPTICNTRVGCMRDFCVVVAAVALHSCSCTSAC